MHKCSIQHSRATHPRISLLVLQTHRGAAVDVRWLLNLSRREMWVAAESASTSAGAGAKKKKSKGGASKPKQGGGSNPFAALMQ